MKWKAQFFTLMTVGGALVLIIVVYALFQGSFDQDNFKVLSFERAPSGALAMVARRSDNQALNGDQIFVLVGPHVFSPTELKHAFYSSAVIFSTDRECLRVTWKSDHELQIACDGEAIASNRINSESTKQGGVNITYVNISTMSMR